jgi:hypothetical protein
MGGNIETWNIKLRKCGMKAWTEFVWLRIGSNGRLLLTL